MKSRTSETVVPTTDRVGSNGACKASDGTKMLLLCAGCEGPILDRFLLKVLDRVWHAKCVQCSECRCVLADKCFSRDGRLYCREDFFRMFGTKCGGCGQGISPDDLVRRARQSVYHLKCFTCTVCRKQLSTGEQLYVFDDNQFICKDDFIATKLHGGFTELGDVDADSTQPDRVDDAFSDRASTSPNAVTASSCFNDDSSPSSPFPANRSAANETRGSLSVSSGNQCGCVTSSPTNDWNNVGKMDVVTPPSCGRAMATGCGSDVIKSERLAADDECSMDSNSSCGDNTDGSNRCVVGDGCNSNVSNNNNNGDKSVSRDKEKGDGEVTQTAGAAGAKRRGPRTTIKAKQLETLKSAFAATPKPTRHIREQLAQETGLNMRVIQVWFQNRRSKERRMKQLSAMGARRQFFRNPRRLRALRPGEDFGDGVDLLGPALGYFGENCGDFYAGYAGFGDYFPGVHHVAADAAAGLGFLTPPTSGPHVPQSLADHVSPQLHDGMFLAGDLVLPPQQQQQQQQQLHQQPARSSPDATMLDGHHFAAGIQPQSLQPGHGLFGHHPELQMTETW